MTAGKEFSHRGEKALGGEVLAFSFTERLPSQ